MILLLPVVPPQPWDRQRDQSRPRHPDAALGSGRDHAGPSVWPPAPAPAGGWGQEGAGSVTMCLGRSLSALGSRTVTATSAVLGVKAVPGQHVAGVGGGAGPPSFGEATTGVPRRRQMATVASANHLPQAARKPGFHTVPAEKVRFLTLRHT